MGMVAPKAASAGTHPPAAFAPAGPSLLLFDFGHEIVPTRARRSLLTPPVEILSLPNIGCRLARPFVTFAFILRALLRR